MAVTKQKQIFEASNGGPSTKTPFSDIIAIGTVIDTSDPMQWGRIRVVVPAWGDSFDHHIEGMPWAMYVSPFGGQTSVGTRGPGVQQTQGGIAYGMWAIPKIGAQVVVMSLDEDHQQRLYLGCVFDAFTAHTMPHGRWISEDHPALDGNKTPAKPYGPYSSGDGLIQPLADNLKQAFGNTSESYEWQTRAADYAVSRVDVSQLHNAATKVQDDKGTDNGTGWISTQGYQASRIDPHGGSNATDRNYDSQTYSMTSPGFHSLSMDDRMENCRMRLRTTTGHQILLDDTNERIYISTAKGNNWIEMDQAGNIDIFTTNKVSIRAAQDINLTSDQSIRMHAKTGIHMFSEQEIRMHGTEDVHIHTNKMVKMEAADNVNIKSGNELKLTSSGTTHINAGGQILETGSQIHLNGPTADAAESASSALFTNRVPAHEPWLRGMTKADDGHESEMAYDDKNAGRMERGVEIPRGMYWRR